MAKKAPIVPMSTSMQQLSHTPTTKKRQHKKKRVREEQHGRPLGSQQDPAGHDQNGIEQQQRQQPASKKQKLGGERQQLQKPQQRQGHQQPSKEEQQIGGMVPQAATPLNALVGSFKTQPQQRGTQLKQEGKGRLPSVSDRGVHKVKHKGKKKDTLKGAVGAGVQERVPFPGGPLSKPWRAQGGGHGAVEVTPGARQGSGGEAAASKQGSSREGHTKQEGQAVHTSPASARAGSKDGVASSTANSGNNQSSSAGKGAGVKVGRAAEKRRKGAARAHAKQQAAKRKGGAAAQPDRSSEALMKAGSNWEALRAKIGATGKGTKLAKEREAASGKKPRSMGSDTGVTPVIALDCEMVGVGPEGERSSLARVAVINEHGNVLLDVFVRQKEKVTDYRTKYSGVRASDMKSNAAVELEEVQKRVAELMQGRLLVGHGLRNDLKAMMLDHPHKDTRDTARYLPLMHSPAPGRKHRPRALKVLASEVLGLDIQAGEHSPVDDARAALYLYLRHRKEWEAALRSGVLKQQALAIKAARKSALAAASKAAAKQSGPGVGDASKPQGKGEVAAAAAAAATAAAVEPGPNSLGGGSIHSRHIHSIASKNAVLSAAQIRALRTGRGVNKASIGSLPFGRGSQDTLPLKDGQRNMAVGGWSDVVRGSAPPNPKGKGAKR